MRYLASHARGLRGTRGYLVNYKTFFEKSIDAMLVIEDDVIVDCNNSAVAMLGCGTKEEVILRSPVDFSPEFQPDGRSSREKADGVIAQAMERGSLRFEWNHQRKDGTVFPAEVSIVAVEEDGRAVLHTVWRDMTERHRMEAALRESEERYRVLVENQSDLVVKVDPEGRFLYVSPSYCEFFGKSEEELLGQAYMPMIHEDDRAATEEAVAKLFLPPHVAFMEQRAMAKEGWRWLAWQDSAILDENGNVKEIIGVGRDITERKRAEEILKESEQRFRSIFDSTNDALFIQDLETGAILDVNRKACELYGMSGEELLRCNVGELSAGTSPHGMEEARAFIRKAAAGEPQIFEWRAKNKAGQLFWVEVNMRRAIVGSEERLIVSVRDVSERKQMEEELLRSEERFRGMFENMGSGVAIYEAVDGGADFVFLDFNPAAERIEQVAREDVVGKRLTEAFPLAEGVGIFEVFQRVWRTGEAERFPVCLREDGKVAGWRDNHIYRLPSGEVVAVYDDLTAQKQVEWALEKSEEKYRLLATNSLDMIWTADLDHHLTFVNDAILTLTGYTPAEYMAMDMSEYTPPESVGKILPAAAELVEECRRGVFRQKKIELGIYHKSGRIIDAEITVSPLVDGEGTLVGFQGRTVDITKRKRLEEERERFVAAIDQAAETIVITDIEGLIQYVNPAFERVTGYAREEAIGLNPSLLKSGEQDESFYAAMWATILEGETWRGIFVNKKKDGSTYTEEATISPVLDASGKIVNFVAIKMDITAELAREEQYRQTQKMESVGRLASGIAHDFNNILQTITGFCGLILAEMDGRSPHRKDVLEIQTAVKHAGDLTRQLMAFSRKRSVDYQTVDLNAVLSEGKKMLRQALDKERPLRLRLGSAIHPVRADATQLLQIAMNLVVNARDAMLDGGEIVLATENTEISEEQATRMPHARPGSFVCLSVVDTGCGMDERQLAHLFEPFYTTKQPGEGTGLGLSVVYGIVEEHGGWIHVESNPGSGSVFRIYLPVHGGEVPDGGSGGGAGYELAVPGRKILLVGDDPMVGELACKVLENSGYAVSAAADRRGAEELFASKNGAFDLLLCDAILPDGDGTGLAESLHEQRPELPVVLFCGESDEHAWVDTIREKGFAHMRKPFNLQKLLDQVNQAVSPKKQGDVPDMEKKK